MTEGSIAQLSQQLRELTDQVRVVTLEQRAGFAELRAGLADVRADIADIKASQAMTTLTLTGQISALRDRVELIIDELTAFRAEYDQHTHESGDEPPSR